MRTERADDELVVAHVFAYRPEAELARGMLEAGGIEAMIEADDCCGQWPLMGASMGASAAVRLARVQECDCWFDAVMQKKSGNCWNDLGRVFGPAMVVLLHQRRI